MTTWCILLILSQWAAIPEVGGRTTDNPPAHVDVVAVPTAPGAARRPQHWNAASLKGIKMGSSKLKDAIQKLGKPTVAEIDPKRVVDSYSFEGAGLFGGTVTLNVNHSTGVVLQAFEYPSELPFEKIRKTIPGSYVERRFSVVTEEGEIDGILVPSESGELVRMHNRKAGIVVGILADQRVEYIIYVSSSGPPDEP